MAGVAQKTVYSMRRDVNEKLARLPLKFFDSHTHGEIMSRVTNDIENISTTLQQSLTQLITSIVTIIGYHGDDADHQPGDDPDHLGNFAALGAGDDGHCQTVPEILCQASKQPWEN